MATGIGASLEFLSKLTPAATAGIATSAAILLFSSEQIAVTLGVVEFRSEHRGEIGAVFIGSVSLLAANLAWWIVGVVTWRMRFRRQRRIQEDYLHNLTPDEKGYLLPFIKGNATVVNCAINDGIAWVLCAKRILYRSSSVGSWIEGMAHGIHPWARKYLCDHPELIDGAGATPPPLGNFGGL